jgi:hypothetical protein
MRKSFNIFAAVTVTALAFSLVGQPVEAATYTWRTSGTSSNVNYSNAPNWVGGVVAVSDTASTTLQFTSNTTTGSTSTVPGVSGGGFGVNQFLVNGTTTYVQGSRLNIGAGGLIDNTSTVLQNLKDVRANGAGFSVISASGTLRIGETGFTSVSPTANVSFTGLGEKFLDSSPPIGITNISGPLTFAEVYASVGTDLTLNGGSVSMGPGGTGQFYVGGNFTGASAATFYMAPSDLTISAVIGNVAYNNLNLVMNLDSLGDTVGQAPGTVWAQVFGNESAESYTGNLGSLVSTATTSPYVGLTWSQVGGNWQSSVYNTNQQLEFRPGTGAIYVVPEPTQMVFVAGVAAAFGAWRMRKLRRNARGSDATAC